MNPWHLGPSSTISSAGRGNVCAKAPPDGQPLSNCAQAKLAQHHRARVRTAERLIGGGVLYAHARLRFVRPSSHGRRGRAGRRRKRHLVHLIVVPALRECGALLDEAIHPGGQGRMRKIDIAGLHVSADGLASLRFCRPRDSPGSTPEFFGARLR
jgi:hypothetical protein